MWVVGFGFCAEREHGNDHVFFETVRVDVVAVNRGIVIAREIRAVVRIAQRGPLSHRRLADLVGSVHMRETALAIGTSTCVSIVRAFVNMLLRAGRAALAVA